MTSRSGQVRLPRGGEQVKALVFPPSRVASTARCVGQGVRPSGRLGFKVRVQRAYVCFGIMTELRDSMTIRRHRTGGFAFACNGSGSLGRPRKEDYSIAASD